MFEDDFRKRLTELRELKKVSARDMSLSLGQNPSYIHFIETGKSMPSMSVFLFICDYFKITPAEFFNTSAKQPEKLRAIMAKLESLDSTTFEHIAGVIDRLS
ncbi:MAG: helix-turn-helix transcriptional regulator [Phascolarctobacterium sp.]|nr:helix-turn-helix transcriptional regulator [Candidatus Phascolarctobacterium caballi]